ncbi:MAG: hypothetical protein OEU36_08980 [Gammaproteobacteria bacterium]|nr:hypothetical protein [Gammaproteobacteria bacterium]
MTISKENNGAPLTIEKIFDLERYPIHDLSGRAGDELLQRCRQDIQKSGVCLLPGFLTPKAIDAIAVEANESLPKAFFCHNTHNAYLKDDDPSFPEDHPRRRRLKTDVGSIAYDHLPQAGALCRLYQWDPLTRFMGLVLGYEKFYRGDDPLGALSINVFEPGGGHSWHFDESHFTVTIMVQPAEQGGVFEYVSNIRTPDDDNYDTVGQILEGKHQGVLQLPFEPGTLSIFAGRNTLHRVTTVGGSRHRLVPVLTYDTKPGSINSDEVRMLFWGRTGREHAHDNAASV